MKWNLKRGQWPEWLPHVPAMLVGGVLVAAAVLKAVDPHHFIAQMRGYGLVNRTDFLALGAWALIIAESTLGWSLIVSYRPRITLKLAAALLMVFIGVGAYAWLSGVTEDCGCFGSWVKRSPKQGVIEGLFMLLAVLFSMAFRRRTKNGWNAVKGWSVAMACLTGLVLPASLGFLPFPGGGGASIGEGGAPRSFPLKDAGIGDLSSGVHLVILMDTDCASCLDSVEAINELAADGDLPEVIALAANDEARRREFMEMNGVDFRLAGIGEDDFWSLLGAGDIPRTLLVRDVRILMVWERAAPDRVAVLDALEEP